jgi:hypothetical protein
MGIKITDDKRASERPQEPQNSGKNEMALLGASHYSLPPCLKASQDGQTQ